MSSEWEPATRDDDGMMAAAEPVRMRPPDWSTVTRIVTGVMAATFAEATDWRCEMSITINPPPTPGSPLDFIEVDIDGRFPWHSTNATFMAPTGEVSDEAEAILTGCGWHGVGTGGPVYKVWDEIPLETVAAEITRAAVAVFPPDNLDAWEISVTVLAAEDDSETSYEVVASATRAVLRRAVRASLPNATNPPDAREWDRACRSMGFDPVDVGSTLARGD